MKKLLILFIALMALLAGCNQGTSPEEIAKIAYKWEKAKFDRDYKKEQEFIYEKGSYEVHKTTKKIDSGLKYENIRFELYYDKELKQYYVFADFDNPNGDNAVEDNIVFRKKADMWKVDTSKSLDINRDEIKQKFEREACINCK
ncbi:hypothetical protein [Neobacillus drentensis]|jgi:hypothetical protein|uniref:hypothetical protein n=1 Tax=Neobacillus drentensis TaxID=220684 RepID=UPI000BF6CCAA|nr:hypothetical protein CN481_16335 [Bacillus sp. AFS006103]